MPQVFESFKITEPVEHRIMFDGTTYSWWKPGKYLQRLPNGWKLLMTMPYLGTWLWTADKTLAKSQAAKLSVEIEKISSWPI